MFATAAATFYLLGETAGSQAQPRIKYLKIISRKTLRGKLYIRTKILDVINCIRCNKETHPRRITDQLRQVMM